MPSATAKLRTLYDKVLEEHIVDERDDGTILLYIGSMAKAPLPFMASVLITDLM